MFKVYRNNLLLICLSIFVLSSLIHFFYYRHAPGIIISEDTYSYYLAGFQMYNKSIPVHYFRPPVYPFFLHGIMAVTGKPLEPMLTAPFYARLPYIIILQSIMISLSNCLLYLTLRKIKVKSFPSLIFVLFISFNIIIFSWFRLLLTEAVAVFLLSLFFYLTVSILIKPTLLKFMFLLVLSLFCVFLRPIYILLPVVPTVIFVIYFQKLRIIFYCFTLLLIYFLSVFLYAGINYQYWGINNISNASYITSFGKVLTYNLNIETAKDDTYFYDKVKEYRALKKELNPFRFMEYYNILNEASLPIHQKMKPFANRVILANLPLFIIKGLFDMPKAIMEVSEKLILLPASDSLTARFFQISYLFYKNTQILFFLVLFLGPLFFIRLFFTRRLFPASLAFLSIVSLYQIIFAVYFGYAEYGRLIVPAQPLIYLSVFLILFSQLKSKTGLLEDE